MAKKKEGPDYKTTIQEKLTELFGTSFDITNKKVSKIIKQGASSIYKKLTKEDKKSKKKAEAKNIKVKKTDTPKVKEKKTLEPKTAEKVKLAKPQKTSVKTKK